MSVQAAITTDRIAKFAAVGAVGATCDYAVLIALVELWSVSLEVAKLAAAETAIVVMFAINERWTFSRWGKAGWRAVSRRLAISNWVRIGGIIVAVGCLSVLVRVFGAPYLLANAVGIGVGFVINYFAESVFTWRVH